MRRTITPLFCTPLCVLTVLSICFLACNPAVFAQEVPLASEGSALARTVTSRTPAAPGATSATCASEALQRLRANDSVGAFTYDILRQLLFLQSSGTLDRSNVVSQLNELRNQILAGTAVLPDGDFPLTFLRYIGCGRANFDLPTAVHEMSHHISRLISQPGQRRQLMLFDGRVVAFPLAGLAFLNRTEVDRVFPDPLRTSLAFEVYVDPRRSELAHSLPQYLDEWNAYLTELETSIRLVGTADTQLYQSKRDMVLSMMLIIQTYLKAARTRSPEHWSALARVGEIRDVIQILWTASEDALLRSCPYPFLGNEDLILFDTVYQRRNLNELSQWFDEAARAGSGAGAFRYNRVRNCGSMPPSGSSSTATVQYFP